MKWVVTGGAGFIGCNVVRRLLEQRKEVVIVDDLSRRGTSENLAWLQTLGPVKFVKQDVRDARGVAELLAAHRDADVVLHLAGQVAVTTSVTDPRTDFEINALGTFNVLEAVRRGGGKPIVLYASTNKVYGNMEQEGVELRNGKYAYKHLTGGVSEAAPLDFHSPYGCSKGTADQYVRDYARIYGMRSVVFRQSCIYGPRQFGIEDQGWVAWFTIAAVLGRPITIFGDGRQVRDVLFADDLADCYLRAVEQIDRTHGPDLQHRRRARQPALAAGAARAAERADRPEDHARVRRLAPGRPEGVRLRHRQGQAGLRLVPQGVRHVGRGSSGRLGPPGESASGVGPGLR